MANILDIKQVGPEKRYASELPKIGIRPVIDGRQRVSASRWKSRR